MHIVGVRELKNRLTFYLGLTKGGDGVIVTDRGTPVAILHGLDTVEEKAGLEEKLASLASRGLLRLPSKKGALPVLRPHRAKGKPASEIIVEERR